jgi:hypothetical protein
MLSLPERTVTGHPAMSASEHGPAWPSFPGSGNITGIAY